MDERLFVGTRKGLFEVARRGRAWDIVDAHFLGDPVSAVLAHDGALYAALDLGHFGAKLWRRDGRESWQELPAPAFPPKPPMPATTRTRGRSARSGRSSLAGCPAGCGSARCRAGCSARTMPANRGR